MNWYLLAQATLAIFTLASAGALFTRRPDWLLYLLPMALCFGGFNFYALGTVWFPVKIVSGFSLLYAFSDMRWVAGLKRKGFGVWWLMLGWVGLATFMAYVVSAPYAPAESASLQSTALRPLVQAYSYISYLSLIPLWLLAAKRHLVLPRFYKAYAVAGCIAVAGSAWQLASFATGREFMPILRMHGEHSSVAAFTTDDSLVYRLYAFSGEPKSLGVFMLPLAIAAIIRLGTSGSTKPVWWARIPCTLAFIGVTLGTLSSAVIIGFVATLAVAAPLLGSRIRSMATIGGLVVMGLLALPLVSGMLVQSGESSFWNLLMERSVGRLEMEHGERTETQALLYLFGENTLYLPLGVGLGMFNFHLPGMHWGAGTEPIDSGWVTWLMDLGLIGTIWWAVIFGGLLWKSLTITKSLPVKWQVALMPATGGLLAALMSHAGWGVFPLIVLWSGVLVAYMPRRGSKVKKQTIQRGRKRKQRQETILVS